LDTALNGPNAIGAIHAFNEISLHFCQSCCQASVLCGCRMCSRPRSNKSRMWSSSSA
jgi:hypothetical protein